MNIVVEGPIGCGKALLVDRLAAKIQARTNCEDVMANPFLADFGKDPKRFAFQLEVNFMINRLNLFEASRQGDLFSRILVSDHLFTKSRIYASLTLEDQELKMFDQIYNLLVPRVSEPDLIIYLDAPIDYLYEHVVDRARSYETHIDQDYIASLSRLYHQYFRHYDARPVIHLNAIEHDFSASSDDLDTLIEKIQTTWIDYLQRQQRRCDKRAMR